MSISRIISSKADLKVNLLPVLSKNFNELDVACIEAVRHKKLLFLIALGEIALRPTMLGSVGLRIIKPKYLP